MPKLVYSDSSSVERTLDLGGDQVLIGRAPECQVQTQDALVSRRHARIVWDGGYWIEDLGSANGILLRGERVAQRAPLPPGEEVRCGSLALRLVLDAPVPARAPEPPPLAVPAIMPPPMATTAPPPQAPPPTPVPPAPVASGVAEELQIERARRIQAEARVEEMQARLRQAEARATAAEARAAVPAVDPAMVPGAAGQETERLRRRVEQLQAEVRRLRGGAPTPPDEDEVLGLDADRLRDERDQLQRRVAALEAERARRVAATPTPGGPAWAASMRNAMNVLNDMISDVRGHTHAARSELDTLSEQAQKGGWRQSFTVLNDAVQQAADQLEHAREQVRELLRGLGAE